LEQLCSWLEQPADDGVAGTGSARKNERTEEKQRKLAANGMEQGSETGGGVLD